MKKLLGIMLCVGIFILCGCTSNDIIDEDVFDYVDGINTDGMSPTGLQIKSDFEAPLTILGSMAQLNISAEDTDFTEDDLYILVKLLTALFLVRHDFVEHEDVLNDADLKVLNEMYKRSDEFLKRVDEKYHDQLIVALDIISNGYKLPDDYQLPEGLFTYGNSYTNEDEIDWGSYQEEYSFIDPSYEENNDSFEYGEHKNFDYLYDSVDKVIRKSFIDKLYAPNYDYYISEDSSNKIELHVFIKGVQPTNYTPEQLFEFVKKLDEEIKVVILEFSTNNVVYYREDGNIFYNMDIY